MSGWPGLNLRNFMAHLAPGVYFSLQFAIVFLFAASFIDPSILRSVLNLNQLSTPVGACLGLLLLTVCYFVGVVLRLSTVDHFDVQSLDYNLRKELWIKSVKFRWLRRFSTLFGFWWLLCWLTSELLAAPPKGIKVREARRSMKRPSTKMKRLERLLDDWQATKMSTLLKEKSQAEEWSAHDPEGAEKSNDEKREKSNKDMFMEWGDMRLRVAVIQYAIDTLVEAKVLTRDEHGTMAAASPTELCDHISTWVKNEKVVDYAWWFAACDSYPYPIRLLYRNWHRADASRRDELAKHYVPLILETVIGEWPGARYTHGPINRAKECVIAAPDHTSLSALVYEREALTRMVAGFFPALRFGFCTSLLLTFGCVVRLFWAKLVTVVPAHVWTEWRLFALGFATLLVCNGWLLARVLANLRSIRYGEVDAVLEAYLLVKLNQNPEGA